MSLQEILRRLENIIQVGSISETKMKEGKALARVILDDDGENKKRATKAKWRGCRQFSD